MVKNPSDSFDFASVLLISTTHVVHIIHSTHLVIINLPELGAFRGIGCKVMVTLGVDNVSVKKGGI
jgi:hypothetical protein